MRGKYCLVGRSQSVCCVAVCCVVVACAAEVMQTTIAHGTDKNPCFEPAGGKLAEILVGCLVGC